jgi:hypothetical protein
MNICKHLDVDEDDRLAAGYLCLQCQYVNDYDIMMF